MCIYFLVKIFTDIALIYCKVSFNQIIQATHSTMLRKMTIENKKTAWNNIVRVQIAQWVWLIRFLWGYPTWQCLLKNSFSPVCSTQRGARRSCSNDFQSHRSIMPIKTLEKWPFISKILVHDTALAKRMVDSKSSSYRSAPIMKEA